MLTSTLGQLLVNQALPEELRDHNRILDKKGTMTLLREVAEKHPEKYKDISFRLSQIGQAASQESGGMSFGLQHLRRSLAATKVRERIKLAMKSILADNTIDSKERAKRIVLATGREMKGQQEDVFNEARDAGNPLATQVSSGTRGNKMNLSSLLGSDLLYSDHHDNPIPVPILHSYSEGLSPSEYWAATYGARRGVMATKFATQDAGFLSKQLNQVAHRLMVVDDDYDEDQQKHLRGLPVDTDDSDNEGALLAQEVGPYARNTVLTPKILKHLGRLGKNKILVRSAMIGGSPEGGVYARDVGIRERGRLPTRGEQVGLQAAQALSEPISQGQLSAKHSGGVTGEEKAVSGFNYINQLIQVPRVFKGGAAHSKLDGRVQRIEDAPAGGQFVTIDDQPHYVGSGYDLKVKRGDDVEAGDVLSEGLPNPAVIVEHKGIGEGRHYFGKALREAMRDAGMKVHRRNVELLARGLINNVRLTDEYEDGVPDDLIPYSTIEHKWQPREGHQVLPSKQALGKYLETPVLHYTIGTKVRPSMLRNLEQFGVNNLTVHDEPPPFAPEMVRGMYSLQHDPDWITRMYGSGLKGGLLDAVHRGSTSNELGTSFVPGLARSVDFGRQGLVQPPAAPTATVAPAADLQLAVVQPPAVVAQPAAKPKFSFFGGKFPLPQKAPVPAPVPSFKPVAAPTEKQADYAQTAHGTVNTGGVAAKPASPGGATSGGAFAGGNNPYSPAKSATNPYAFRGGYQAGQGLLNNPLGVPIAKHMNHAAPGIGGAIGFGALLDTNAVSTLTSGSNPQNKQIYGAAGYEPPTPGNYSPTTTSNFGLGAPADKPSWMSSATNAAGQTASNAWSWIKANPVVAGSIAATPLAYAGGSKLLQQSPTLNKFVNGAKAVTPVAAQAAKVAPQAVSRFGQVLSGLKSAGGAAAKYLGPLGYVLDAGVTGNEVLQGRGAEYADSTAKGMQSAVTGGDGWLSPLTVPARAVGAVFSPVQNANLIAHGVGELSNLNDLDRQQTQAQQQGEQLDQQRLDAFTKSMGPIIAKHQAWEAAGRPAVYPDYSAAERSNYNNWQQQVNAQKLNQNSAAYQKMRDAEAAQYNELSKQLPAAEVQQIREQQGRYSREPQYLQ